MKSKLNDINIRIATVNGTGSQSSNQIIMKSLFRMGLPVSGKNLFPSNIFGLPTWFHIRVNEHGHVSFSEDVDVVVAMNKATIAQDIEALKKPGVFIYNSDIKFDPVLLNKDNLNFGVPFKELVKPISDSIKLKKLLTNMVYVGIVAELIEIDKEVLAGVVKDFFKSKASVVDLNLKAIEAGYAYASEHFGHNYPVKVTSVESNTEKLLIDGNTAGALGAVFGGCTFASWYPITPSSSIMEEFEKHASKLRLDSEGKRNFAVVQSEDELASIGMVVGAGWAGARAMTATSGPGMSLMSEFVGLSYFAEVPSVIWNIQRVGPSTGLPTRTQQGDLRISHTMGHGDGRHPVLIPANPKECFEFGKQALDLSERLQTFVCVLSDLDIGMNLWSTDKLEYPTGSMDRGKVLDAKALEKVEKFARYEDVDGDSIPYRTLPGTHSDKASFFTRGTGHMIDSTYSEDNLIYEDLVLRLRRKEEKAKEYVPKPIIKKSPQYTKLGIIAYGSSEEAMSEVITELTDTGVNANYMRVRALPFTSEVESFLKEHDKIIVVEQNRDGQMAEFLKSDYNQEAAKIESVLSFDGLPIRAYDVSAKIKGLL